ncbi:MAG: Fe-S protein assembly co-chaperone HscB [Polyangiaceae bacterium]
MGLAPSFELDLAELEKRHRELSRVVHPDKFANTPAAERRRALSRAVDVNESLRVLRDPIRRAEALLSIAGVPYGENKEPRPAPALLMEMLSIRKELSAASGAKDRSALEALLAKGRARERAVEAKLAAMFPDLLAQRDPALGQRTLETLGELRYARRFSEEASAFLEDLG